MGLTKTQTMAACLLVAAAPVTYEWHAAATARSAQKTLRAQLLQIQDDLTARQQALEQVQRRLRSTDSALVQLRANAGKPSIPSAIAAVQVDAYLWDESSEYVRLPKAMLEHLTLRSSPQQTEATRERKQDAVSVRDGSLSSALIQALGITPEEETHVREAFHIAQQEYQRLNEAFLHATNQIPRRFDMYGEEATILVTARFPEDGQILKEQLRLSLESALGKERSAVLWQQAENGFQKDFNDFGALERWEGVALHAKDKRVTYSIAWWSPGEDYSRNQSNTTMPIETAKVPEIFQPVVAEWQTRFKSQAPSYE